jgi:hypothetical protein
MTTTIELFPEFAWAVPKAFSVPLRDCRFEQGDRVYNTPHAYQGSWNDALSHLEYSIEVLSPPRGQGIQKSDKDSASTFASNWSAPVELILTIHKREISKRLNTTQGRLYSMLWHGDLTMLDAPAEPAMPFKSLVVDGLADRETSHFRKKAPAERAFSLFLTPFDETNDIFTSKANLIRQVLSETSSFEFHKERPHVVYGNERSQFAPTLYIGCYVIDSTDTERLEAAFKKALYVPVKNKVTDRENWNLQKHGTLVQVGI